MSGNPKNARAKKAICRTEADLRRRFFSLTTNKTSIFSFMQLFTVEQANRTLPLVRKIVEDVVQQHRRWREAILELDLVASSLRADDPGDRATALERAVQALAREIDGYKREIDTAQGKQRVEQVRTPKFAYFQGPQPQTQIQVLDGDTAFNVGANGAASRLGTATAERDRQTELFHHPITALIAATVPLTTVTNVRTVGSVRQADFAFRDRAWTMTIDAAGLPLSISSKTYHPNLGDVVMTTTLSKALGSQGGVVLGPRAVRDHLIDAARPFIFDTGLAPAGTRLSRWRR